MSRAIRMEDLEADIRWQADHERADLRHTSAKIRRAANQSIQNFRELISDNGFSYFLTSNSGNFTVGRAADPGGSGNLFAWGTLEMESIEPAVVRVYGLDIEYNNLVEELTAVQFNERNYYSRVYSQQHFPVAFFGYNENTLGILPPPDRDYKYNLWYLPLLPDLLGDDDEFNPGVPGADQWIVWDVMIKLLNRDNFPDLIQSAMIERNRMWEDILHRATAHQRADPPRRLDTRGRSRTRQQRLYFSGQQL